MEGAGLQLFCRLRGVVHHLDRAHGGAASVGQRTARIREANPSTVALQELQPDRALEVPDLLGHRGLGQEEGGRRPRDVLVFRDRHEGPYLLECEGRFSHRNILVGLIERITNS